MIDAIKNRLSTPLPGKRAQIIMAPHGREELVKASKKSITYKKSAVLILLYEQNKKLHTIFMKRNVYNGAHSAEVSIPGGKWEKTDTSLEHTAIREFCEETGFCNKIKILGKLTSLTIPISSFHVTPFIGYINHIPNFSPSTNEVQYIIETDLESLFRNKTTVEKHSQEKLIKVPCYATEKDTIWGATAMIISELESIIKSV